MRNWACSSRRLCGRRSSFSLPVTERQIVALGPILGALFACAAPVDPVRLIDTYTQQANNHQVEAAVAMFAPDARLDFGPIGVVQGHDDIRMIAEYDRVLNTQLQIHDCVAEGLRAVCRATENNNWLTIAAVGEIEFDAVTFDFNDDGLIAGLSASLSPPSMAGMTDAMSRFDGWARSTHPERYGDLFLSDGRFKFGSRAGQEVIALLELRRRAGYP